MGISAKTFLLIDDWSISICIFVACGENASILPVTRSSNRAPIFNITSQLCIAKFASYVPCIPNIPRKFGLDAGNAPKPISVKVTGNPVISANS